MQHGDGSTVSKCVSFNGASLTGEQVLDQAGVTYTPMSFGGLSDAICRIDGEPEFIPPTCWTSGSPFWEIFVARKGGGWASSNLGASAQLFQDGDAEGFRYEAQSDQLPPKILGNCPGTTPTPNPTPKATPRPTPNPTPRPSAGASAGPTPFSSPTSAAVVPSSAPGASPAQPPLGDVAAATASAAPTSDTAGTRSSPPTGSGNGSPALPIAIVAIAGLAGLAALRRRPGRSGPMR